MAAHRIRFTDYYFCIGDEVLGRICRSSSEPPVSFRFTPPTDGNQMNWSRFYATVQIECCRNFIFKRHFTVDNLRAELLDRPEITQKHLFDASMVHRLHSQSRF